jgi:hypothetical protein
MAPNLVLTRGGTVYRLLYEHIDVVFYGSQRDRNGQRILLVLRFLVALPDGSVLAQLSCIRRYESLLVNTSTFLK